MNYKLIKESRKALGYTQKEVAAAIGMTHGSYRNFENGYKSNTTLSSLKLLKLCKLLNMEWSDLVEIKP